MFGWSQVSVQAKMSGVIVDNVPRKLSIFGKIEHALVSNIEKVVLVAAGLHLTTK